MRDMFDMIDRRRDGNRFKGGHVCGFFIND